jgi:thiol-disulfide isomerase/thioredoxin
MRGYDAMNIADLLPFLAVAAVAAAIAAGRLAASRQPDHARAEPVFASVVDALFAAILCARAAFVVEWWSVYRADPLSVLRLFDGGYAVWAGVAGGIALIVFRVAREPRLRAPMFAALAAGGCVYGVPLALSRMYAPPPVTVPAVTLARITGESQALAALTGRPLVVSAWASWCPPCRREMPLLLRARQQHGQVTFVLVNQGEQPDQVRDYAQSLGAPPETFLLDVESKVSASLGSRVLPATYFFNARGELDSTHIGELSEAVLLHRLSRIVEE